MKLYNYFWWLCVFIGINSVYSTSIKQCQKKESTIFCLKTFKTLWKTCVDQIDPSTGCYNGFCANFLKCDVTIEQSLSSPSSSTVMMDKLKSVRVCVDIFNKLVETIKNKDTDKEIRQITTLGKGVKKEKEKGG